VSFTTLFRSTTQEPSTVERLSDRERLNRARRLRAATESDMSELDPGDVEYLRFGIVRASDGRTYKVARGEIDTRFCPATAYVIHPDNTVTFLEPITR
jgi:hypothetical protein